MKKHRIRWSALAVVVVAAAVVYSQDVFESPTLAPELPVPAPVASQASATVSEVSGSLTVSGGTRYEISGLIDPTLVDGIVSAGPDSKPKLIPYGFVSVSADDGAEVRIKAEKIEDNRIVKLDVASFSGGYKVDGEGLVYVDVTAITKQTVTIEGQEVEFIKSYEQAEVQFVIETTSGPDPPDPVDPPNPDGSSPFAGEGLRVLIVYERDDVGGYPQDQLAVLFAAPFRTWLNEQCVEVDGAPAYRILDADAEPIGVAADVWAKALQRQRDGLPWILIGNGTTGYEGPLPADIEATKTLIARFK
jgi:hypothetical protein